jgi:hypothetical protein
MLLLSGCSDTPKKQAVKVQTVVISKCAVRPVELCHIPDPLVIGETTEQDVWIYAKANREDLKACNKKIEFINQELLKSMNPINSISKDGK